MSKKIIDFEAYRPHLNLHIEDHVYIVPLSIFEDITRGRKTVSKAIKDLEYGEIIFKRIVQEWLEHAGVQTEDNKNG